MTKKLFYILLLIIFPLCMPFGKINAAASDGLKDDVIKGLNNTMDQSGLGDMKKDVKDITAEKTSSEISGLIGKIIRIFILAFVGATFLGLTIYGGYLWLTSGGNEEQIAKARKIITSAAVGMLFVLSAYAITYFFLYNLADKTGNTVPAQTAPAASPSQQENNSAPVQNEPGFDDNLGNGA